VKRQISQAGILVFKLQERQQFLLIFKCLLPSLTILSNPRPTESDSIFIVMGMFLL
jgi:hypothetical protein